MQLILKVEVQRVETEQKTVNARRFQKFTQVPML